MKKIFIAAAICISLAVTAGLAISNTLNAPWYNESSGWDTWIIMTSDPGDATLATVTVTFYSSTGAALASTVASVSGDGAPWVQKVESFITASSAQEQTGSITFTEGSGGVTFDDLNVLVGVQRITNGVGFIIPLGVGTINNSGGAGDAGKYTVCADGTC